MKNLLSVTAFVRFLILAVLPLLALAGTIHSNLFIEPGK